LNSEPASDAAIVHFGSDALARLPGILLERGVHRVLLVTGAGGRWSERLIGLLAGAGIEANLFDRARGHVPVSIVDEARHRLEETAARAIVTLGGGAATGLGKALRRTSDVLFVAVPTTYAGSEMTSIWGITEDGRKQTGRDRRVRPDVVLYDPALTRSLPLVMTLQSLFNAMAQSIGALSTDSLAGGQRASAMEAIRALLDAARQIVVSPQHGAAREQALRGCSLAGCALEAGRMGVHHRLAHLLGGRFSLPHAAVHSVLLPHTVRALSPSLATEVGEAAGSADLPAELFELLLRVEAPVSLSTLGVEQPALEEALDGQDGLDAEVRRLARAAWLGRRPSWRIREDDWGLDEPVCLEGPPLNAACHVVIALHGRGSNAGAIIARMREIVGDGPGIALVAPQAGTGTWYPGSYRDAWTDQPRAVESALGAIEAVVARVREQAPATPASLAGFSQGACLALEWAARNSSGRGLSHVIAFSGARLGPATAQPPPAGEIAATAFLLAIAENDAWVSAGDVRATASALERAGAAVETLVVAGDGHEVHAGARIRARALLRGTTSEDGSGGGMGGYGNHHSSEALDGALPRAQNNPRHAPYGLWAEQVSGTGFVAARRDNRRSWLYRIRPSVQHRAFAPLEHGTFGAAFVGRPAEVDLCGWDPLAIPDSATDFVDGLATIGGAGDPALRRGYAIHTYAANRGMEHRAFYDADGDLLILPQLGGLTLLTELGVLDVDPGQLAIVPRGLKMSVLVRDGEARGYVAETFGRHFELPERGPIGANSLADERHFLAPAAWYENRLDPGYRLAVKLGGRLHETTQDHSPYDVVAWHGNYAPCVYDLMRFSPVSNVRFDHADPSVYTVLTAPMDEQGTHTLDLVVFPPRWDPTEGTFRPPYFHRNVTTELNGIIRQPERPGIPFRAGGYFLTPSMTAHGVVARSIEQALAVDDDTADRPSRSTVESLWFQFETALPMSLTPWAESCPNRIADWRDVWGVHRTRFQKP
jgi:homogentisate 1,2-dioxygenase